MGNMNEKGSLTSALLVFCWDHNFGAIIGGVTAILHVRHPSSSTIYMA